MFEQVTESDMANWWKPVKMVFFFFSFLSEFAYLVKEKAGAAGCYYATRTNLNKEPN